MTISIESLLAARVFLSPQLLGNRLYFLSNLGQGGHLSLYVMDVGGSVPEPLLPARIALQNPELMEGEVFAMFPKLGKILLMLDQDGDEHYQPMLIPLEGGIPEPAFGATLEGYRVRCLDNDPERNLTYPNAESLTEQAFISFQANLETGALVKLGQHTWGSYVDGVNADHTRVILKDSYAQGITPSFNGRLAGRSDGCSMGYPWRSGPKGKRYHLTASARLPLCPMTRGCYFSPRSLSIALGWGIFA